jgi:hypothetical protein
MTAPAVTVIPQPGGSRWYDRVEQRVARPVRWVVSPITGDDGRPSWWKIMGVLVLASYWRRVPLPESVAVVLLFCAFGVKVALALIAAGGAKVSLTNGMAAALGARVESAAVSSTPDESHPTIARRDPDTGTEETS